MAQTIFLSHSTQDDAVVDALRVALEVQRSRHDGYKVIPVLYDGVTPDAIPGLLGEEVVAVTLGNDPNAITEALKALLPALGLRLPDDLRRVAPRASAPLAELTLHLTAPDIVEQDGTRRATALAELTYRSPDGAPAVRSEQYPVTAPLGPLEADDLVWYLERYAMWPSAPFQQRAREVEAALPRWGQALYALLHAHASTRPVLDAWQTRRDVNDRSQRRFSVLVDDPLHDDSSTAKPRQARVAATQWLSLPWELLHDGQGYLFQGARGVRVRRQLPGSTAQPPLLTEPPLRVAGQPAPGRCPCRLSGPSRQRAARSRGPQRPRRAGHLYAACPTDIRCLAGRVAARLRRRDAVPRGALRWPRRL